MDQATDLTGIAFIVVAATLCGIAMVRFRQPAIIGYILTGILLGPSGLGVVENRTIISLLAELGVILLLYFVGLELSLRVFRYVWRLALFSVLAQTAASVGAMLLVTQVLDWPFAYGIVFGFALALSSTAVAIKVLEDAGELHSRTGRITVGVLIAQDLAVAPMLLVVRSLSGGMANPFVLIEVFISIALLVGVIRYMTGKRRIDLPFSRFFVGKSDLMPLAALAWCFGFAALAGMFGMSPAFGAFLAGLIAGNSAQRHEVRQNAEPIQVVLLMVFFLSVGLLIDIDFMLDNFWLVLIAFTFVMVFKTALNAGVLRALGERVQTAFTASLVMGQMGEFAFVLSAAAAEAGIIGSDVHKLVVAVTVLTLIATPLYLDAARRLHHRASRHATTTGSLLRLIYFREWRKTRHAGRAAVESISALRENLHPHLNAIAERFKKIVKRTPGFEGTNADATAPADSEASQKTGHDNQAGNTENGGSGHPGYRGHGDA